MISLKIHASKIIWMQKPDFQEKYLRPVLKQMAKFHSKKSATIFNKIFESILKSIYKNLLEAAQAAAE